LFRKREGKGGGRKKKAWSGKEQESEFWDENRKKWERGRERTKQKNRDQENGFKAPIIEHQLQEKEEFS